MPCLPTSVSLTLSNRLYHSSRTTPPNLTRNFFTSGSREADQRASQRMAKDEQLAGTGEGSGEKGAKEAKSDTGSTGGAVGNGTNQAAQVQGKLALYDRLGAEAGISNIVADFIPR